MTQSERIVHCLYRRSKELRTSYPNIDAVAKLMKKESEPFRSRIETLDAVLKTLNAMVHTTIPLDPGRFENIMKLRELLEKHKMPDGHLPHIPTLHELYGEDASVERYPSSRPTPYYAARSTFSAISKHVQSRKWEFPTTITDNPHQVFSGMLIEGYGEFTAQLYGNPGLARQTVLAIEEVVFDFYPKSPLTQDILPWMREERADFSPIVANSLIS